MIAGPDEERADDEPEGDPWEQGGDEDRDGEAEPELAERGGLFRRRRR